MYGVAVVGAGMIGSSTARWCSELAPEGGVVLVGEGEGGTCQGAWYDEGRITRTFYKNPNWRQLAAESIKRYRTIEEESGVKFFNEVGSLALIDGDYPDPTGFQKIAELLQAMGYSCQEVKGEEGAARFPYLNLTPGLWGYHQPESAGHLSPRGLVSTLHCFYYLVRSYCKSRSR